MKVLVTGGAGYIGAHTCIALQEAGYEPVILDSLVNGREEFTRGYPFYKGDISDETLLNRIAAEQGELYACIHFAARIIVPESVENPYLYYRENVVKSLELFRILDKLGIKRIIFSSSASVYGTVEGFAATEDKPKDPGSPYARTKYMMEMVLEDCARVMSFKGIALRYFNPIGADPKYRVGPYDPSPTHVVGKMVESAMNGTPFNVTGVNWPTRDGSGIRDYLHIWDLALAHVAAVQHFDSAFEKMGGDFMPINLGSGNGCTVFELAESFDNVFMELHGKKLTLETAPARPGDVAGAFAVAKRAEQLLHWRTQYSVEDAIRDMLVWTEIKRKKVLGY
ncbi:MAG: UDP-glucose 4-epimerase GalE [Christensenellales bacterium]